MFLTTQNKYSISNQPAAWQWREREITTQGEPLHLSLSRSRQPLEQLNHPWQGWRSSTRSWPFFTTKLGTFERCVLVTSQSLAGFERLGKGEKTSLSKFIQQPRACQAKWVGIWICGLTFDWRQYLGTRHLSQRRKLGLSQCPALSVLRTPLEMQLA